MKQMTAIAFCALLLCASGAWAANRAAVASGNWNAGAGVWSTGACGTAANTGAPANGDVTTICAGVTVTLTSSPTTGQITISGVLTDDGAARSLTIGGGGGNDLTNNGQINLNSASSIILGGNNMAFAGTGTWTFGQLNIGTRPLSFANAMTLNLSNATPISISTGSVTDPAPTLITWNFNGSVAQTLPAAVAARYGRITINNAAGVTLGFALSVLNLSDNLVVQTGTLKDGGLRIQGQGTKTFQIASGATFQFTNANAVSGFGTYNFGTTAPCGTFEYALAGAQTVTAFASNFGNLKLSGSGAKTMPGTAMTLGCDFEMTGSATATSGNTLSVGEDFLLGGTSQFTAGAAVTVTRDMTLGSGTAFSASTFTHNIARDFSNNGTTFTASTGLFNFNGGSAQAVGGSSSTSFNSVTIANTSGGVSLGASETVGGTLTLTSGTLAVGANTLTLNGPAIAGAGANSNLSTTSSSSLSFGGSSGSVFIPSNLSSLNDLTINNTNGVTENSSLTLAGTLTLTNGALSVGANTLTLNGPAISQTSGSLTTTSSSNLSFTGSGTSHFIPGSVAALNNLTINNSNGVAESSSITLAGALTLTSGALSVGANTLTLNGPAISQSSGTLTTTSSSNLSFTGSGTSHFIPSSVTALNNLTINNANGVTESSGITLSGTLTLTSGALSVGSNTLTLNGPAISQTSGSLATTSSSNLSFTGSGSSHFIPSSVANLNDLTLNNSNGLTMNGNLTLAGSATITSGTLDTTGSNRSLSVAGSITGAGTLKANGSAISVAGDMTVTTFTQGTSTVTYNGSGAQAAGGAYTYNNLVISKSGNSTATLGGNTAVSGNLTINANGTLDTHATNNRSLSVTGNITGAGTLVANASAISVAGNMTVTTFTAGTSTVTYNGGSAQTAGGTYSYKHLTINKSGGTANLGGNATVTGTLTLTAGNIDAGANTVIITSAGSVSRTSGHVIGNLQKNVATGATSRTFEVGDASVYAPLAITFASVTTAGDLTVKTVAAEHPDIANSGIDSTQDVTRYWVATNTGIIFTTYTAAMTYVGGDVDGGSDLTTFGIARADSCNGSLTSCTWRMATVSGAITNTNATATGMNSFSSIAVGRRIDHFVVEKSGGGNIANQDADTSFGVRITAVDSNGNTINGFGGSATVTSGCTVSAGSPVGFTNGVYTGNVTLSGTGGSCTLTSTLSTNVDVTGTSNTFVSFRISSFNVAENGQTPATGKIFTRIAATNFNVDYANAALVLKIHALDSGGSVITGFFPRSVTVEVVNGATGGGVCANMDKIADFAGENFVSGDSGSHPLTAGQSIANVYRNARFRIKYTAVTPNITSCSVDNFAIRPASLTVSVTHGSRITAGTTSSFASKATADTTTLHNAGRPFTIQATGKNSSNATTNLYDGTPASSDGIFSTCSGGDACVAPSSAAFNVGSWSASGGTSTTNTATYSEVGAFQFNMMDSSFASVDAGDGTSDAQRIVNYSPTLFDVGRFVPNHFDVSYNAPQFTTSCAAGSFTYVGQAFNFGTAPVITVTAKAFTGATTTKYHGATLARITNSTLTGRAYSAASGTLDTGGLPSTASDPTISSFVNGVGTLTFSGGSGLAFTRTTPVSPFNADISLALNIIDADSVVYESPAGTNANPARFSAATAGNGIAFSSGKSMRFGRLRLLPATGAALINLVINPRVEYWNGSGFTLNSADSCTTLSQANIALGSYSKNLNACETRAFNGAGAPPQTFTFSGGTASVSLAAPGLANDGSVVLTANLGTVASGNYCQTLGGAQSAATAASKSYLQGGASYDQDPRARFAFGVYGAQPNSVIYMRENY